MNATLYGRIVTVALVCVLALILYEVRQRRQVAPSYAAQLSFSPPTMRPVDYLAVHIGDIQFSEIPLRKVLGILARRSGANLGGDWAALQWEQGTQLGRSEVVGVRSTQTVTLKLENPTLGEALRTLAKTFTFPSGECAGVGRDPAGLLLLGMAGQDGDQRSVTTLPLFYDVDDIIGPPAVFHSRARLGGSSFGGMHSNQCRQELEELSVALRPFIGPGDVGCFGRRLVVNGYADAHDNIAAALDRLRHPIHLTQAATRPSSAPEPPKVPTFLCPAGTSAREAWQMWQKLGAGHVVVEFNTMEEALLSKEVDFEMHDSTPEEIANGLIEQYRWPLIVVPAGDQDDRLHVRQFRWEDVPRAYDVSAILAHPDGWIADAENYVGNGPAPSKDELLRLLITVYVPHDDVPFLGPGNDPALASCWNGMLLLREDPQIHVRVLRFLEHLQRTGRPIDPPPDQ